jgi:hypothetical protein
VTDAAVPLIEELEQTEDPVAVCARFLDLPYLVFLESASRNSPGEAQPLQQFSFLAADPSTIVRSKGWQTEIRHHEDDQWRPATGDAFRTLRVFPPSRVGSPGT